MKNKSVVTSIRLPEKLIKESKRQAKQNGFSHYQTMLKQIIQMALEEDFAPKNIKVS